MAEGLTPAEVRARKEQQVLELRRAGVTFDAIAEQVGYANRGSARKAYQRALARAAATVDLDEARQLEVDRLDRLQVGLWRKAVQGDVQAADRVLKIIEQRSRLVAAPTANSGDVLAAFEQTVESSSQVGDVDAALVAAGRKIASRIDTAVASGEGTEVTKALYLAPHLVNILREMLATPAARKAVQGAAGESQRAGRLAQLRSIEGGRGRRSAG